MVRIVVRLVLLCVLPSLLASGCMVRKAIVTENLPTGETRETFVEALPSGADASTLSVDAAVIDGDRLEALLLSQPTGCRSCVEQRAEQVTVRQNKLDNTAKWGIPLLYGLGGVTLIPLVEAKKYDKSDWRTYGPVLAVGGALITVPTINLLATIKKTTLERKDVWLATEECRDVPCPQSPAGDVELFLAVPAATPPEPPCDAAPARCARTGEDGRITFDLAAAGFAAGELAGGAVDLVIQTDDETVTLHSFAVTTTPAHAAALEELGSPEGDGQEADTP